MQDLRAVNWSALSIPMLSYRRVAVLHTIENVAIQVPDGKVLVIDSMSGKWNEVDGLGNLSPEVRVRLYQNQYAYCDMTLPLESCGTPGCRNVTVADVSATQADSLGKGVAFKATPLFDKKPIKIPVHMRGLFLVELSGMTVNSDVNSLLNYPAYIDILIEGRLYPQGGF